MHLPFCILYDLSLYWRIFIYFAFGPIAKSSRIIAQHTSKTCREIAKLIGTGNCLPRDRVRSGYRNCFWITKGTKVTREKVQQEKQRLWSRTKKSYEDKMYRKDWQIIFCSWNPWTNFNPYRNFINNKIIFIVQKSLASPSSDTVYSFTSWNSLYNHSKTGIYQGENLVDYIAPASGQNIHYILHQCYIYRDFLLILIIKGSDT